jgi:hypothetical protein
MSDNLPKETANFQEEQIGFPPYWTPEEGKKVYARVVDFDDSDPEFLRYVMQAGHDIDCQRGPSDAREEVTVHKGEFFTMSQYASLPLGKYLDIPVLIQVKEKRKIDGGKTMWVFSLSVSEQAKKILAARRQANMLLRHNAPEEHKAELAPHNGKKEVKAEDQIPF